MAERLYCPVCGARAHVGAGTVTSVIYHPKYGSAQHITLGEFIYCGDCAFISRLGQEGDLLETDLHIEELYAPPVYYYPSLHLHRSES